MAARRVFWFAAGKWESRIASDGNVHNGIRPDGGKLRPGVFAPGGGISPGFVVKCCAM